MNLEIGQAYEIEFSSGRKQIFFAHSNLMDEKIDMRSINLKGKEMSMTIKKVYATPATNDANGSEESQH